MAEYVVFGQATIAPGASLSSNEVKVAGATALWIAVPTWTDSAAITFQNRGDGSETMLDTYDELGQELQLPASTHNRCYPVPGLVGSYEIKVRSGTSGAAQNQTAAETITVFGMR